MFDMGWTFMRMELTLEGWENWTGGFWIYTLIKYLVAWHYGDHEGGMHIIVRISVLSKVSAVSDKTFGLNFLSDEVRILETLLEAVRIQIGIWTV